MVSPKAEEFSRTASLIGENAVEKLLNSKVAVFGLGGVGGYVAESLVRSGIGSIDIIDGDTVSVSNLNRQIIALHSTIGMYKTDACENRFLDINPDVKIKKFPLVLSEQTINQFDFSSYDYVVDAIDDVKAKVLLAVECNKLGTPIISSMGAGNKLHPERFEVADIYKTSVCPLARVMRTELKKHGVNKLKVVFSTEEPYVKGKRVPASIAFVPSAAGLVITGEVIRDICDI